LASNGKDAARVFSDKVERPLEKSKEGDIRSGIADSLNGSDINITLHQTVTTASGATKMKTLATKVPKPVATGLQTPTIIQLPG
jgi:hypothetical protein